MVSTDSSRFFSGHVPLPQFLGPPPNDYNLRQHLGLDTTPIMHYLLSRIECRTPIMADVRDDNHHIPRIMGHQAVIDIFPG